MYRRGRASRTVVVAGSASGLGRALRRRLTAEGCRVVGVDLAGEEVSADLGTPQGRVTAMNAVLDLTDQVIDGLVLCAGLGSSDAPPARLVSVNYHGSVALLDGLRPVLSGGTEPAAVVVVPNTVGIVPVRDPSLIDALGDQPEGACAALAGSRDPVEVHAATKLALVRAVRGRALSWGRSGIRLNALARGPFVAPPGRPAPPPAEVGERLEGTSSGSLVDALPVPLDRPVTPDDIAGLVVFLLGPEAAVVHGALLFGDAGTDALLRPDHI